MFFILFVFTYKSSPAISFLDTIIENFNGFQDIFLTIFTHFLNTILTYINL